MTNDPATTDPTPLPGAGGAGSPSAGKGRKARTASEDATATVAGTPKRSTEAEVSQRVEAILRLRIDGAAFADLREFAGEQGWGVSDSMLRKYIEKANKLLKERTERSRSHTLRLHRARREALYARALQAADFRTALAVLDSDAKLIGLFPDGKTGDAKPSEVPLVEITTDDRPPVAASE